MNTLLDKRPATVKGVYFKDAYLKTTMGPSWKVNVDTIDPRNRNYMLNDI